MSEHPIRVSAIVEWENVLLAEAGRGDSLIRTLARQARELVQGASRAPAGSFLARLSEPIEVLVVVGDEAVDVPALRELLASLSAESGIEIQVLEARGLGYYELKNFGAAHAQGDLLVLLDSDVAPHADWLQRILEPFADETVQVVGGHAYIAPTGIVAKAFATFWLFPDPAATETALIPSGTFFANSVIFRRDVFLGHPFRPIPGTSRGACRLLAKELNEAGIPVYKTSAARVAHPSPHGLRQFATRGLAHGRDSALFPRCKKRGLWRQIGRDLKRIPNAMRAVFRARRRVELTWPGAFAAAGVAAAYYGLFFMGALATRIAPSRVVHAWRT